MWVFLNPFCSSAFDNEPNNQPKDDKLTSLFEFRERKVIFKANTSYLQASHATVLIRASDPSHQLRQRHRRSCLHDWFMLRVIRLAGSRDRHCADCVSLRVRALAHDARSAVCGHTQAHILQRHTAGGRKCVQIYICVCDLYPCPHI